MEPTFGQRLAVWLKHRGLSQTSFARKLGCSKAAVCGWVSDATGPTTHRLPAVAAALGVTLEQFFGPLPELPRVVERDTQPMTEDEVATIASQEPGA